MAEGLLHLSELDLGLMPTVDIVTSSGDEEMARRRANLFYQGHSEGHAGEHISYLSGLEQADFRRYADGHFGNIGHLVLSAE